MTLGEGERDRAVTLGLISYEVGRMLNPTSGSTGGARPGSSGAILCFTGDFYRKVSGTPLIYLEQVFLSQ
jgi:hypothetical protein